MDIKPLYIVIGGIALFAAWYLYSNTSGTSVGGMPFGTGVIPTSPVPAGAPSRVTNGAFRGNPVAPARAIVSAGPSTETAGGRGHF
jgi:hypothetical protein